MINVNLTQDEQALIKRLLEDERMRLTNTDYDAEIIVDAEEKNILASDLFHKILIAK